MKHALSLDGTQYKRLTPSRLGRCALVALPVLFILSSALAAHPSTATARSNLVTAAAGQPRGAASATVTVCATADAYIAQVNPDMNSGLVTNLRTGFGSGLNEPYATRTLVRFDLSFIPSGVTVTSAIFRAMKSDAWGPTSGTVDLTLYPSRQAWNETGVTWNNQPAIDTLNPVDHVLVDTTIHTVVSWDMTWLAQSWVLNPGQNNGFEIEGPETGDQWMRQFESRDAGIYCPQLEVTYNSSSPVSTPTFTPTFTATPTVTNTPPVCPAPDGAGNTLASATWIATDGSVKQEYLCPSGDTDWWKFYVGWGQRITVSLSGMPTAPEADYNMDLVRPNNTLAGGSYQWGAQDEFIDYTANTSADYIVMNYGVGGDYGVRVTGRGVADWSKTTPYKLWVKTEWVCDPDEAGNTFQSAAPVTATLPGPGGTDIPIYGTICPAGDQDWYKFKVPAGETVTINAALTQLPADYDLALYDPNGLEVASSTNLGQANEQITYVVKNALSGDWRVRVAGGHASFYNSATYRLDVKLTGNADLTIQGIEVTQATQRVDNSIPLISGKPTTARVYVGLNGVSQLTDVTVELRGYRYVSGVGYTVLTPVFTLGPRTVAAGPVSNQRLFGSFDFLIPPSWLSETIPLFLEAKVNPAPTVPETDYTNNTFFTGGYGFTAEKLPPINVIFVPMQVNGVNVNLQNPTLNAIMAYFRAAFPDGSVTFSVRTTPLISNHNLTDMTGGNCGGGWDDLLGDIASLYIWMALSGSNLNNTFVYGLVDPTVPRGYSGCGSYGQRIAAGILDASNESTLVHELGHNFGRHHAPRGWDNCGYPKNVDQNYPVYANPAGGNYPYGSIGEVGYNPVSGIIYDPAFSGDVMSYCPNPWVSPYTYEAIESALWKSQFDQVKTLPIASFKVQASAPYLIAMGRVSNGQLESLRPFWIEPLPPGSYDGSGTGPYSIELQNAEGTPLFTRHFDVGDPYGDPYDDDKQFTQIMPFATGTARIVIRYLGTVLRVVTLSAHAPTVTVTSPNGGETWDANSTYSIAWQASDADGDPLVANVLYSADGGTTWKPLAVDLRANHYEVSSLDLSGSSNALVQVQVSDGVNTSFDVSNAPFSVSQKAPQVFILNPQAEAVLSPGQSVILQGVASSFEQGTFPESAFFWSSSLDGELGGDSGLQLTHLSIGLHRITLAVSDDQGRVGSASVNILVGGWRSYLPYVGNGGTAPNRSSIINLPFVTR